MGFAFDSKYTQIYWWPLHGTQFRNFIFEILRNCIAIYASDLDWYVDYSLVISCIFGNLLVDLPFLLVIQ